MPEAQGGTVGMAGYLRLGVEKRGCRHLEKAGVYITSSCILRSGWIKHSQDHDRGLQLRQLVESR